MVFDGEGTSQLQSISAFLVEWRGKFVTDRAQRRRRLTNHPDPIVLPKEGDNSVVDIKFETRQLILYVRFMVSTLHCIGFSLDGIDWHEVLVEEWETSKIPNSTVVESFTSSHDSLRPCDRDVTKLSLIDSLNLLGMYIKTHDKNKKEGKEGGKTQQVDPSELERAFGVIVTIFCEGARFRCLEDFIGSNFESLYSYKLDSWALKWINKWRQISRILQEDDYFTRTGNLPGGYTDSDEFKRDMEEEISGMTLEIGGRGPVVGVANVRHQMAVLKYHNPQ